MKPNWLSRRIAAPGPYLTLCTTEAHYIAAMRHLKAKPESWLRTEYSDATMHGTRCATGRVLWATYQGAV
jgi:hypothetical protein